VPSDGVLCDGSGSAPRDGLAASATAGCGVVCAGGGAESRDSGGVGWAGGSGGSLGSEFGGTATGAGSEESRKGFKVTVKATPGCGSGGGELVSDAGVAFDAAAAAGWLAGNEAAAIAAGADAGLRDGIAGEEAFSTGTGGAAGLDWLVTVVRGSAGNFRRCFWAPARGAGYGAATGAEAAGSGSGKTACASAMGTAGLAVEAPCRLTVTSGVSGDSIAGLVPELNWAGEEFMGLMTGPAASTVGVAGGVISGATFKDRADRREEIVAFVVRGAAVLDRATCGEPGDFTIGKT